MSTRSLPPSELENIIVRALVNSRTSDVNARSVAAALVQAEIDGQKGHGVSRVQSYAAHARAGKVDGHAIPQARQTRAASLQIDAANGFAYPAIDLAVARLPSLAASSGVAAAAITRSHHFGVAGRTVERFASQGLVALAVSNSPHAMAAWGGRRSLLGTNPIAFAAPQHNRAALVIDMALSEVARGKIVSAAQKGEPIPAGWALDATGRPTTDARAALAGTLLPASGGKGAALALMVEILAVALSGANFAFEASSFFDDQGPPPGIGHVLVAIDPTAFAGADRFGDRLSTLVAAIEGDGARLPGSRRLALREAAARHGVKVETALLEQIEALAGS
jgi:(2R)-3-sulfolactate dehydrogenase (NADP+)